MLYFMEVWQEELSDLKSFRNIFVPIVQINQSAAQPGLPAPPAAQSRACCIVNKGLNRTKVSQVDTAFT